MDLVHAILDIKGNAQRLAIGAQFDLAEDGDTALVNILKINSGQGHVGVGDVQQILSQNEGDE